MKSVRVFVISTILLTTGSRLNAADNNAGLLDFLIPVVAMVLQVGIQNPNPNDGDQRALQWNQQNRREQDRMRQLFNVRQNRVQNWQFQRTNRQPRHGHR